MRILLTNDDGYLAPGINVTFQRLIAAGHEVIIVAPERNSSGAGQSIAVYNPISLNKINQQIYFVTSTPADSVRLGLQEIYGSTDNYPDLIISGINLGENIGEDVLYSGTVGAAREGTLHGSPSLAFSTPGPTYKHLASAADIVVDLVAKLSQNHHLLGNAFIWNVNIPDREYSQIKGYEITKLGSRPAHYPMQKQITPRGDIIYWQGMQQEPEYAEYGTDIAIFIKQEYVSITPLELLPTAYDQMPIISSLME